ncbi:hypothetical protein CUS73_01775 [Enterococcus faecalis]|nr:hypothetical protein HMPREF2731_01035 [Enterococcus sp. HMSC072F02]PQG56129.1 hypothetical protein CUS73_01775 [Enterococcus faecalis]
MTNLITLSLNLITLLLAHFCLRIKLCFFYFFFDFIEDSPSTNRDRSERDLGLPFTFGKEVNLK